MPSRVKLLNSFAVRRRHNPTPPGSKGAVETQHDPNLRWNFWVGVCNGFSFRVVDTLVHPSLVLVIFLAHLTDNPLLLGMAAPLFNGGWMLPQLWASGRVQRLDRAMPVYKLAAVGRMICWLGLILAVTFLDNPDALILSFFVFMLVFPIISGVGGLAFMEIVARVIPPRMRGLYFSWRLGFGGLFALGGSAVVNWILDPAFPLGFPHNFAFLFALAAIMSFFGLAFFQAVREPAVTPHPPAQTGLRGQWKSIRRVWREDVPYRRFILSRIAMLLAAGVAPLIIIYTQERFALPLDAAAVFLVADTAAGLIAMSFSGWLSLRLGNGLLTMIAAALGLVAFVMILAAGSLNLSEGAILPYFTVVFILLALFNGVVAITFTALNLNLSPTEERPMYLGMANTIFGVVFYFSAGQGALASLIGYDGLFLLAAALMCVGFWYVAHIKEPVEVM